MPGRHFSNRSASKIKTYRPHARPRRFRCSAKLQQTSKRQSIYEQIQQIPTHPDLDPTSSPRVRAAALAVMRSLPRMLDKACATIIGKNGEYHFNCPLDQHILNFALH